jgi:6-phosphogluconate dehydrogenase (decarboxylating)
MVGLGRMGGNMGTRLQRKGHHAVAFDLAADAVARAQSDGATGTHSLEEDTYSDQMLAMMRHQFGGHAVMTTRP